MSPESLNWFSGFIVFLTLMEETVLLHSIQKRREPSRSRTPLPF